MPDVSISAVRTRPPPVIRWSIEVDLNRIAEHDSGTNLLALMFFSLVGSDSGNSEQCNKGGM